MVFDEYAIHQGYVRAHFHTHTSQMETASLEHSIYISKLQPYGFHYLRHIYILHFETRVTQI